MADLIATSPFVGLHLPMVRGDATLSAGPGGPVTSITPFVGQEKAVAEALKPLGIGFPAPGLSHVKGAARIVWAGRGTAFLIGLSAPAALAGIAALTDQSDGWAALILEGAGAEAVLARLIPLDLRVPAFRVDASARTLLGHMPVLIVRVGATAFEIRVFRSMARTAVHEISGAMGAVAARG